MIEFVGPLMLVLSCTMLVIINEGMVFDEMDSSMRLSGIYTFLAVLAVVILFTGGTYLPHIVSRSSLFICWLIYSAYVRKREGDNVKLGTNSAAGTFMYAMLEISVYNAYKAKA